MQTGGTTENVATFSGYLQLIEVLIRDRIRYEDAESTPLKGEGPLTPQTIAVPDFDDEPGLGRRLPLPTIDEVAPIALLPAPPLGKFLNIGSPPPLAAVWREPFTEADLAGLQMRGSGIVIRMQFERPVTVQYEDGGDQLDIRIRQVNQLIDIDLALVNCGEGVSSLHDLDVPATLTGMLASAEEALPEHLQGIDLTASDPVAMLTTFQLARAASPLPAPDDEDAADAGLMALEPGRFVDGEKVEDALPFEVPQAPERDLPEDGSGQVAVVGGNETLNAATIVDAHQFRGSLVVKGDYYRTDLIVQTNVYRDNDDVAHAGGPAPGDGEDDPAFEIGTDGTKATNIADFEQRDVIEGGMPNFRLGYDWNVDIFEGDFLDLKVITQTNFLIDNDTVVQANQDGLYTLQAGMNQLGNLVRLMDTGKYYDVVIVLGDYHEANMIFQRNILLDDDIVRTVGPGDGDGPGGAIHTGDNLLTNYAAISRIGTEGFGGISGDLEAFIQDILDRDGTLDMDLGWELSGNGSATMNVLVVTGNYYDFNIISQTNIVADVDTVIQYLPQVCGSGPSMQVVVTGDNVLTNAAAIVDAGSIGDQFLGGTFYDDAILVQTNIIAGDDDEITASSPEAIVGEVVAFLTPDDEPEPEESAPLSGQAAHHDMIGNMLT